MNKRGLGALLVVALLASACAETAMVSNQRGNQLYQAGRYKEALDAYREAQVERPDLFALIYNAANALHRQKDYQRAAKEMRGALSGDSPQFTAQAYYNLGNFLYTLGQLEGAVAAYKDALRLYPSDKDAKYNLEYVLRKLEEQKKPPNEEGDKGKEGAPEEGNASPPGKDGNQDTARDAQGPPQPVANQTPQAGGQREPTEGDLRRAVERLGDDMTLEEVLQLLEMLQRRKAALKGFPRYAGPPQPVAGRDW